jgi:hypothetical protein
MPEGTACNIANGGYHNNFGPSGLNRTFSLLDWIALRILALTISPARLLQAGK